MVIKDAKRCDMHHILGHLPTTKDIPLDHMTISLDHLSAIYCHPEMPLTISRAALGHLLDHPPNTTGYLLHHRFLKYDNVLWLVVLCKVRTNAIDRG